MKAVISYTYIVSIPDNLTKHEYLEDELTYHAYKSYVSLGEYYDDPDWTNINEQLNYPKVTVILIEQED